MVGNSAFYLTPIQKPKSNVWFKCLPMGVNSIGKCLKRLTMSVNTDDENFTNSSLRRTAKTRLCESGIPREVSNKKTGKTS